MIGLLLSAGAANAETTNSVEVQSGATRNGSGTIVVVKPGEGHALGYDYFAGEKAEDIAKAIAAAAKKENVNVVVKGSEVIFSDFTTVRLFPPPPGVKMGVDHEVVTAAAPVGAFGFDPNPETGGTVTTADALISAGFTSGLPPVSFTEPAGTDIQSLASALNAALQGGGYQSYLVDPFDVEVLGFGADLPADFVLGANPLIDGEALGISVDVSTVPEPGSIGLIAFAILGLLAVRRFDDARRHRGTSTR